MTHHDHERDRAPGRRRPGRGSPAAASCRVSTVCSMLRDLAELGLHAGGDDDAPPAAVGDGRAGVDHVRAVADGQVAPRRAAAVCFSTGTDSPVSAASSTCRLTASIRRGRRPAPVAGVQQDHVAGHELARGDARARRRRAGRSRWAPPSARSASMARSARYSCTKPEQHGEQHDHGDDDRLDRVAEDRRDSAVRRRAG